MLHLWRGATSIFDGIFCLEGYHYWQMKGWGYVVVTNCPLMGISDIHHNDEEEVCNLRSRRQLVRRDKNLWRIRSLVMMSAVTFSLSYFFLLCFFFLEVVITIKSVDLFVLSFRLFFRLVELFCRRKIQRSERKGSFLKNGMILICRIQDSRLILTIKKDIWRRFGSSCALCAK